MVFRLGLRILTSYALLELGIHNPVPLEAS